MSDGKPTKTNEGSVDPAEVKEEYQKELDGAFEEVVSDLEGVREKLHSAIDEIAEETKKSLSGSK